MYEIVLVLNAIWFALGFHAFAIRGKIFAKSMVPREHRDTPVFDMYTATGKFMGGFNFAFCVLSILLIIYKDTFPEDSQRIILFIVLAVAHGSQFLPNVSIALANRKGEGVWQVKGRMLFIFVTDFVLMVTDFAMAAIYAAQ